MFSYNVKLPFEWKKEYRLIAFIPQKNAEEGCVQDEFTCASGQCIPSHRKCDGRSDCDDGSDESYQVCYPSEFYFSHTQIVECVKVL